MTWYLTKADVIGDALGVLSVLLIAIAVYLIGIYLHSKIIKVSIKEKDMTWKLDDTNSSLLIAHYTQSLFMHGITFIIQDLHKYMGKWFCYAAKVTTYYGNQYVQGHTLVVSIMKYIRIIHWEWAREFGETKITKIFFWINFLHPIGDILVHLFITPDFFWAYDGYQQIDRCLGDPKHNLVPGTNKSLRKLHNLCNLDKPDNQDTLDYSFYVVRKGTCWTQIVLFYCILGNFLEILLYSRIFWFMRRRINPSSNVPASHLSDNANEINMKKLQVNAQVTYFTSLLELIGNATIVIHVVYTKSATFSTLIHNMVFYCILSPHAFLMNTSHNKYRIVEYGWKNVICNLFRTVSKIDKRNDVSASNRRNENSETDNSKPSIELHTSISKNQTFNNAQNTTSDIQNHTSQPVRGCSDRMMEKGGKLGESDVSKKTNFRECSLTPTGFNLKKDKKRNSLLDVIEFEKQGRQLAIFEKLVRSMEQNVDQEVEYDAFLKKLQVFIEFGEKQIVLSFFEIENIIEARAKRQNGNEHKISVIECPSPSMECNPRVKSIEKNKHGTVNMTWIDGKWENDRGIIFDSIFLDWLLSLLFYGILIGIGCLMRWYYHKKAIEQLTDYATNPTPTSRHRNSRRRRKRRKRSRPTLVSSNQKGNRYCKISTISSENEKVSRFDKTRPILTSSNKKLYPLSCGKNHVKFLEQAHYDSLKM